jgi:5-methylcytosine-specific restriction enzyme A
MRKEFSVKTQMAAYERCKGICEECARDFTPSNPAEYDHVIEDYYEGGNGLDNCRVVCRDCHKSKTGQRAATIAKSRRLLKQQAGIKKRSSFYRPRGMKYNWQTRRYERIKDDTEN